MKIVAQYEIKIIDGPLLINCNSRDEMAYCLELDGFNVNVCLNPEMSRWNHLENEYGYWGMNKIIISVSREEKDSPPDPECVGNVTSYSRRQDYFQNIETEYKMVCMRVYKRVVMYFKYKMGNPGLSLVEVDYDDFSNPKWYDKNGNQYSVNQFVGNGTPLPDLKSFSVNAYDRVNDESFITYMEKGGSPSLIEEYLADARDSIFKDNYRRAVIEMAIACEVAVKYALFYESKVGWLTYTCLEQSGRVRVGVEELIKTVASRIYKKKYDKKDFKNIEKLFLCRNEVAHRGRPVYYDKERNDMEVEINKNILAEWWESVEKLIDWLKSSKKE